MVKDSYQLELTAGELAILTAILRYSLDACPVESLGAGFEISHDDVEALADKLERVAR